MGKVSIVMPVYNVEKYIYDSVSSVVKQTYENIEIILVDDGSQDKSVDIAESLLGESGLDFRVIHQKNAGLGAARNTGLLAAGGDWVYFLDSDDMIAHNAIEIMLNAAKDSDADIVFCGYKTIYDKQEADKNAKWGRVAVYSSEQLQECFLKRTMVILAPGTLYRTSFLKDNNLIFAKIPWSEDQHFIWRVLYHIDAAVFVDTQLYYYLMRENSIMSATKANKMIESYKVICGLESYYAKKKNIAKFIVPRWVMGTLNSATLMLTFRDWKCLAEKLNITVNFNTLRKFPSLGVKWCAALGVISPYLYYVFTKWRLKL